MAERQGGDLPVVAKQGNGSSLPSGHFARMKRVIALWLPGHLTKTALIIGIIAALYLAVLFFWAQPTAGARVVVSADLHSERVSFKVVDPAKAAFFIDGMKAGPLGAEPGGECLTGLFTPARNATVTYGRRGEGAMEITVNAPESGNHASAAGHFEAQSLHKTVPIGGDWFMTTDPGCKRSDALQFPIWGDVAVGLEFRAPHNAETPEPSVLIDGTISVAAKSVFHQTLYTVTSLSVPTGSRLQAYDRRTPLPSPQSATPPPISPAPIWWGTAYVDPQHTALVVELATETPNIALYRPNQTEADRIGASGLTQLTDDPDIVRFHILLFVFIALAISCDWVGRRWHYRTLRISDDKAGDR